MNEPNDTAQEGFDQLKRNLEVRYPEDSDLSLDEFLNVESLLALAVRVCGPGADPRKADRLLSNYQLIRPETIGADGHLMQMAPAHRYHPRRAHLDRGRSRGEDREDPLRRRAQKGQGPGAPQAGTRRQHIRRRRPAPR